MPTTNINATPAWTKIVDDGAEFFLSLPFLSRGEVEVATVASGGAAPALTVTGHVLRSDQLQEMNRDLIGTGDVYVLCRKATVPAILTTWT
jgi:hypothetical protein